MNKEGYIQLHIAIIEQARKDFMHLFPLRGNCKYRAEYNNLIRDLNGDRFKALLPFGMTPEQVIEIWTKESEEGENNAISKNGI